MSLPRQLGRYRVERELGKGAMGRVYLAHDPAIDRRVAVKTVVLPEGISRREHDEIQDRFRREVQAAGRLAHPNIVTIHDLGEQPGAGTFVAMEYVQGEPLSEFVEPGRLLDPRTVASIGCQAADALAYAHRNGVVHRDIKPANLILVDGRIVKIADFGLAKHAGASMTTAGSLLGTPYYMSPEQIRGIDVDGRSDLFSLAIVIYELLTGKRPFRGESISTVIYRIINEPPVEPDLSRVPGSDGVKAFLGRALAKNPGERFQSGDDFARHLREAMTTSDASVAATAPPSSPAVEPPVAPGKDDAVDRTPDGSASAGASVTAPGVQSGAPAGPTPPTSQRARTPPAGQGPARAAASTADSRARTPAERGTAKGRSTAARRASAGAADRRRKSSRRRGRRKSVSMTPVLVVLGLALAGAYLYREDLADLVWSPSPQALPLAADRPAAGEPEVTLPTRDTVDTDTPGPQTGQVPAADATGQGADRPRAVSEASDLPGVPAERQGPATPSDPRAATAEPPPVPTLATLRSKPPGARFFVDGRPLPGDSRRVPLADAQAAVEVRAVLGCREATATVTAADAGSEVVMELAPAVLPVTVVSEPGGGRVRIDGRDLGEAPVDSRLDACESHEIVIERDGYQKWTRTLELTDGRLDVPERLVARLEPIPMGEIVIPQPPFPARILLGGHQPVSPGKLDVVAGSYRVVFVAEDLMFRREVRVRVPADGSAKPDIRFPEVVELTVLAQPSNASITLEKDGLSEDLGYAPINGQRIVTGSYTIRCRFHHNDEEQTKTIQVGAGDSPRVRFVAGRP